MSDRVTYTCEHCGETKRAALDVCTHPDAPCQATRRGSMFFAPTTIKRVEMRER